MYNDSYFGKVRLCGLNSGFFSEIVHGICRKSKTGVNSSKIHHLDAEGRLSSRARVEREREKEEN